MKEEGWSQQKFADNAGITQIAVSRILRGRRVGASIALKLAPYFGVKPETLMK
jgi:transcriptional regulator with XRE-family HTH domain